MAASEGTAMLSIDEAEFTRLQVSVCVSQRIFFYSSISVFAQLFVILFCFALSVDRSHKKKSLLADCSAFCTCCSSEKTETPAANSITNRSKK